MDDKQYRDVWQDSEEGSIQIQHETTETTEIEMSNYARFDRGEPEGVAEIPVNDENGKAKGPIRDSHIEVESASVNSRSQIQFYRSENSTSSEQDYAEDPGKKTTHLSISGRLRESVRQVIEHIAFRAFTVILIILDFSLVIVGLATTDEADSPVEITSHIIISYFLLEVTVRIFYLQKRFFYSILDMFDAFVIVVSFVVDMVYVGVSLTSTEHHLEYAKIVVIGRVVRIIRAVRIIYIMVQQRRHVATASRRVVSQNKRRYEKDGFDLDLCYITERVIAMSFPSKGLMAMYRNPVEEVARFFNTKHPNHYRIYNLCSERDYNEKLFHNRVERVYIDDHNVPRLREMVDYCDNVRAFMAEDPRNVIAVHCKGGKGRTGTMICTWLVDCGLFEEAKDSLDYFGDRRTDLTVGKTFQGVETPSQSRYVGYYHKVKKTYMGKLPERKEKKIVSIKIEGIAGVGNGDGSDLSMEIRADGLLIFECRLGENINCQVIRYTDSDSIVINLQNSPTIAEDIKIRFLSCAKNIPIVYDNSAFFFWFHTSFIQDNRLLLTRDEIDNPHKKKAKKVYRDCFSVELKFEDVDDY